MQDIFGSLCNPLLRARDNNPDNPASKARILMREGKWKGPTKHRVPGYVKCNLVILPLSYAFDFLVFCLLNPKPCPVIEVTRPGGPESVLCAPGADLRTDLPRYSVFKKGKYECDRTDILDLWRDDFVCFLIGSGMTFDDALERAGVQRKQTWVLNTGIRTIPHMPFSGTMVVTMRLMKPEEAIIACQVTSKFYLFHGAPIHIGDPREIGADIKNPIVGKPLEEIPKGNIPVFWACGVTPQKVALSSKIEIMITHAPAHSFVTDLLVDKVCIT